MTSEPSPPATQAAATTTQQSSQQSSQQTTQQSTQHSTQQSNQQVFCGNAPLNSRILNGSSATAGSWPWMASLQKNGSHVCGATLVSVDAVLTDAACFSG